MYLLEQHEWQQLKLTVQDDHILLLDTATEGLDKELTEERVGDQEPPAGERFLSTYNPDSENWGCKLL